jgi:ATP-dependent protease HslVU (ClpYQ) ATPase subunit
LIGDLQILKTNYRKDNIDFDKLNKLEEVCISIESDKFKNITKIANQFNCTTFKFITRAQTIVLQLIDDLSNVIYEEEFGDTNVELSSEYLMDDVLKVHPEKNMYNINLLVLERQTILNINTSLMQYYMSEKKGI